MILDAFALSAFQPFTAYAPDDDGGGGNSGGGVDPQVLQSFQNFLGRNDGERQAAFTLFQENYQQRQELRQLRDEKARLEAQAAKVPKEGAVVLEGDDAARYRKLKETGKLDDFDKILKEHEERGQKLARLQREQTLREVADKVGFNFNVLRDRDQVSEGLEYEVRQVEADGKKQEVVYVKQGEGEAKPLAEYAKEHWSDYLPALTKEENAGTGTDASNNQQRRQVTWPRQSTSTGNNGGSGSVVDDFIQKRDAALAKRPNPLRRPANGE